MNVREILTQEKISRKDLVKLLSLEGEELKELYRFAAEVKKEHVGNKVYYRGLVELSNICSKNCLYCGIRKGNKKQERYNLTDEEVLAAARFAWDNKYGSLVVQSGELESKAFASRIEGLVKKIKELSKGELGITLSCGEQSPEVYQRWFDAGAHRYLLRIESSNPGLYYRIHPQDEKHDFYRRLKALRDLQQIGYQTGTGVMVGLPMQTLDDLAGDLLFMKEFDIDMVGMGPYIVHDDTPLAKYAASLPPEKDRLELTFKMIALLRILMKDINMAATTAMQAIDPTGREKAIQVGANVVMPNITPGMYRENYQLYENKPCMDDAEEDCKQCLEIRVHLAGAEVGYNEWGDSKHFFRRKK